MTDLASAYRHAVCSKVEYLERSGKEIHPATLATYRAIVGPGAAPASSGAQRVP
jgi:HD superfamily phosphohydrolase YqeK